MAKFIEDGKPPSMESSLLLPKGLCGVGEISIWSENVHNCSPLISGQLASHKVGDVPLQSWCRIYGTSTRDWAHTRSVGTATHAGRWYQIPTFSLHLLQLGLGLRPSGQWWRISRAMKPNTYSLLATHEITMSLNYNIN